uniref:Uncharacterized protein n=1 Tax=Bracon brevicornis TaxID=1563983 RepID=A0A6V7INI7_9HYME
MQDLMRSWFMEGNTFSKGGTPKMAIPKSYPQLSEPIHPQQLLSTSANPYSCYFGSRWATGDLNYPMTPLGLRQVLPFDELKP